MSLYPKQFSREFFRAFWALAKPYWVSKERGKGLICGYRDPSVTGERSL